ncbi:pseudouridine synthase [Salipaludibacillus daqingensis]|uniref:pseudouridine synthase n=1 Tax=Salipaludibacillus daqingensis TaxID=3041001 RepID=UPI0024743B10|nr:pseudouridine synthase [Salipaludibacillus daqingensis]
MREVILRTDKLLASMGYGSRKEVKKLLKKSAFTVNGETVKDGKFHVNPENDLLEIFGERVDYKEFIYLMMNKPAGYVSATEDKVEKTVVELLETKHQLYEPFPVGRLDKDTTGLLLLTNDGKLAHQLTSPKKKVDKTYLVYLDIPASEEDILALERGVTLEDGYETKPAKIHIITEGDLSKLNITIQEGKYHQVKRMFQTQGKRVVKLERKRMGSLHLDLELEKGHYRELTEKELIDLQQGYSQ